MTVVTYRGRQVGSVKHLPKKDRYVVRDVNGFTLAELSRQEYFSFPQLRQIGETHGRHRQANSKVHGNSAGQSGNAVNWRTVSLSFTVNRSAAYAQLRAAYGDPEPLPIENAGIRAGEVIALRAWEVKGDRLFSVYRDDEWKPNEPMRGDVRGAHGVHAFKDMSDLRTYIAWKAIEDCMNAAVLGAAAAAGLPKATPEIRRFVVGTVALWGDIVEHTRGYRAEFARVASLDSFFDDRSDGTLAVLRERYMLPAVAEPPGLTVEGLAAHIRKACGGRMFASGGIVGTKSGPVIGDGLNEHVLPIIWEWPSANLPIHHKSVTIKNTDLGT